MSRIEMAKPIIDDAKLAKDTKYWKIGRMAIRRENKNDSVIY